MKKPITTGTIATIVCMLAICLCAQAYAGRGTTPKGKPFIELQGQIIEVQAEVSTLQDQVDSIVATVDSIEERVLANADTIDSLMVQNATLQAQIDANATDIVSLQTQIAALEAENASLQVLIDTNADNIDDLQLQIDTNTGIISSLQQELSNYAQLEDQIAHNAALISALESEITAINAVLAEKQRIITGSCPAGQSIQAINDDGSVVCEIDDIGGASTIDRVIVGNIAVVGPSQYQEREVLCPDGYTVTGGGFLSWPQGAVIGSVASNNGWRIMIDNTSSFSSYTLVHANCIQLAP